jgi:hypothetical protein
MRGDGQGTIVGAAGNGWRALAALAVPGLLVVVAFTQLYLAHQHDLSTWKGGGFGMFAAIDAPGNRFVRTTIVTEQGEEWAADVAALERESQAAPSILVRAQSMPDRRALEAVAELVGSEQWVVTREDPVRVATVAVHPPAGWDDEHAPEALAVVAVRVEVLRVDFDPVDKSLSAQRLGETYVEIP